MIVSPQSNKLNIIIYLRAVPAIYVAFVHYANGFVAYLYHSNLFSRGGVCYSCRALDSRLRGNDENVDEILSLLGVGVCYSCRGYFFYFVLDFRFI